MYHLLQKKIAPKIKTDLYLIYAFPEALAAFKQRIATPPESLKADILNKLLADINNPKSELYPISRERKELFGPNKYTAILRSPPTSKPVN